MALVLIQHKNRSVVLNATLDPCSDASFITKTAASEVGFDGPEEVLQLSTVNGKEDVSMKTGVVQLSDLHSAYEAEINIHVISSLDGESVSTNWNTAKSQWPHMRTVPFPRMSGSSVDFLIGLCAETTQLFVPLKTVKGADSDPVQAVLTPLGWAAFGTIKKFADNGSSALKMRKNVLNCSKTLRTHVSKTTCKEEIEAIKCMTDLEVLEVRESEESLMSREEQAATKKVSKSLVYNGSCY